MDKGNDKILQDVADGVKEVKDAIDATLKEKNPEELDSHENLLFDEISNTVIKILTDPSTNAAYARLKEKLNTDISKELVELISTVTTFATYNAIAFYDMMIKEQIQSNFKEFGDIILRHDGDIEVLRLKVGDIEKRLLINKVQDVIDKVE